MLFLPGRRSFQRPSGVPGLNYGSPQTRGLRLWYPFGAYPVRAFGVVNQDALTANGTVATGAGTQGAGWVTTVDSGYWSGAATQLSAGQSWAIAAWLHPTSWGSGNPGIWRSNGGAGSNFAIFSGSTGYGWLRIDGNNFTQGSGTGVALNATSHVVMGYQAGGRAYVYVNGREVYSADASWVSAAADSTTGVLATNNGTQGPGALWFDIRRYDVMPTAAEIWALYDPSSRWSMYWTPSQRVYFDIAAPPAGGTWPGGYTGAGYY